MGFANVRAGTHLQHEAHVRVVHAASRHVAREEEALLGSLEALARLGAGALRLAAVDLLDHEAGLRREGLQGITRLSF